MNLLKKMLPRAARKSSNAHRQPNRLRARLLLEGLEARLAPANVFVVPLSQPTDASHFYTLAVAVARAGTGGVVTVEPGASADVTEPVNVTTDGMTIQGDPNVPGSILPSYQLNVTASFVKLTNLNLSSVTLGIAGSESYSANSVTRCLVGNLTENGFVSTFSQNIITGVATFHNDLAGLDQIANNTFETTAAVNLLIQGCMGTVVTQNTFYNQAFGGVALLMTNTGTLNSLVTVSNNTIALTNFQTTGIEIIDEGINFPGAKVNVLNNSIATSNGGTGLSTFTDSGGANLEVMVQGNDFHNNAIGVSIAGSSSNDAGIVDLGGGVLGSLGGNNFKSFTANATPAINAISIYNAQVRNVAATSNMFVNNIIPSNVVYLHNSAIPNLGGPLSTPQSFVQAMYNELLGRTGSLAELNGWVTILAAQGQAAVANDILRSTESLGRVVDQLYIRFLGRQSDAGGRAFWIGLLQNGTPLETVEAGFLTSPEYLHHINTDYVQSLYINILGRTGSPNELASWYARIQAIGLVGIANGFLTSQEYRADSVSADIAAFLHRPAAATELGNFIAMHTDLLGLETAVLSTPEYFTNG